MDSKNSPKLAKKYCCETCDYYTCKITDYNKHISTAKHQSAMDGSKMVVNGSTLSQKNAKYNCQCGRSYKYDSGYYRHKKICTGNTDYNNEVDDNIEHYPADKDNLIMMLIKQNAELIKESTDLKHLVIDTQTQMMKVIENGTHNTTNNTTNSHNKAFNLNFFLNETCKDAMNIMDFVDSIKLQLSDLEKVGEVGYVEGISNIIVKNLNELDVTQRPVHCTDKKRETMYIRDEDKWEKDENNSKIKKAIKRVASKNQRLLPKFKEAHPDCGTYHSKYSDQYNKIIIESVGGSGDNDAEKEEKIIRNISKNVVVEK
jgi:hypothetical protein